MTTDYIVDYTSIGNRDLLATEQGSLTKRYVYAANGRRISAEFDYAPDTQRGTGGENISSDFGVERSKVWYRTSHLGSTLFTVDADGAVIGHTIYDPWGKPLTETTVDINNSGMDNANNYTGYTYDVVLDLYFAQNRFYDPVNHRFTQEDIVKDGGNWYVYVANSPMIYVDVWGNEVKILDHSGNSWKNSYGHTDISVDGVVYSFAPYDPRDAGVHGIGVIMVVDESTYIQFRTEQQSRTVTTFTLNYTKEQEDYLKKTLQSYVDGADVYKAASDSEIGATYYYGQEKYGMETYNITGAFQTLNCVTFVAKALNDTIKELKADNKATPRKIAAFAPAPVHVKNALQRAYLDSIGGSPSIVVDMEIYKKGGK